MNKIKDFKTSQEFLAIIFSLDESGEINFLYLFSKSETFIFPRFNETFGEFN